MNTAIGLGIIILGILAIAFLRPYKTILYRIGIVALFILIPLFAPSMYLKVIGVLALFTFWRWRMSR